MSGYNFLKDIVVFLPEDLFYLNSVDPDEMPHYAAFHLGPHCLFLFFLFDYLRPINNLSL